MLKLIKPAAALISMLLLAGVPAAAEEVRGPDELVRQTVDDALRILRSDKDVQAGNAGRIAALMEEKVVPHFDLPRMTRLAVGRPWREATPEQRDALIREFRTLLVRSYAAAFTFYRGISVEVRPVRMEVDAKEASVSSLIRLPGGAEPIAVDYDMLLSNAGWKVYDVRVGGASLVINYRNIFAQEIQRGGIDGLLKNLVERNRGGAPATES
ncbi:MAG TPA: ABC transporter substrate-binding protein [Burkholderiales bacterium]|nr:ABC transporter substrate-binding protein [Burkholderiales bacterium]